MNKLHRFTVLLGIFEIAINRADAVLNGRLQLCHVAHQHKELRFGSGTAAVRGGVFVCGLPIPGILHECPPERRRSL
jgi:hypothetical protein